MRTYNVIFEVDVFRFVSCVHKISVTYSKTYIDSRLPHRSQSQLLFLFHINLKLINIKEKKKQFFKVFCNTSKNNNSSRKLSYHFSRHRRVVGTSLIQFFNRRNRCKILKNIEIKRKNGTKWIIEYCMNIFWCVSFCKTQYFGSLLDEHLQLL